MGGDPLHETAPPREHSMSDIPQATSRAAITQCTQSVVTTIPHTLSLTDSKLSCHTAELYASGTTKGHIVY